MRRWIAVLAGALALFLVLPVSSVAAHASFVSSDPVDGSVLVAAPEVATLRFSEDVLVSASRVTLLELGSGRTDDLVLTSVGDATVSARLPVLARGAYILRFVVVDPADLHETVGSISFGIGVAAPPAASGEEVDSSWPTVAVRAASDGALILCTGAVVLALVARLPDAARWRLGMAIAVTATATSVGWVILFQSDVASVGSRHPDWGSLLFRSDPGRRAFLGVELAAALCWMARMYRRARPGGTSAFTEGTMFVILCGFVGAAAAGGHAGVGGSFAVGVALRIAHLGSLGAWIGTIAVSWWLSRGPEPAAVPWKAVSRVAAIAVAISGASGLLLSGRVVATVTALLDTTYGRLLVAKAAVLGAVAMLGGWAARRVARGAAPRRIVAELAGVSTAIVLAAVLAGTAPARGERFSPLPAASPQIEVVDVRDLTVSAAIEPARPGANLVQVRVLDTRKPSPGPVTAVRLRVRSNDGETVVERSGAPVDGVAEWPDIPIERPGTYSIEVTIDRAASPVDPVRASWTIRPAPVPRATRVLSTRPWAPLATASALGWLTLVGLARRVTGRT